MANYAIELRVRGVDMYHTVMKLVESNPEIEVIRSEMVLQDKVRSKGVQRHRGEDNFEARYHAHLRELAQRPETITSADAAVWCKANGYNVSSASSLTSLMVKRGLLQKGTSRGTFRVVYGDVQ